MKIDFNVPFLKADGSQEMQPQTDNTKLKPHAMTPGHLVPEPKLDAEGFAILEVITVGTVLRRIMNIVNEGDNALSFEERNKKAKLARKVGDATKGSLKNYNVDELKLLQEQVAKNGSTELVGQVDDLINGGQDQKDAA